MIYTNALAQSTSTEMPTWARLFLMILSLTFAALVLTPFLKAVSRKPEWALDRRPKRIETITVNGAVPYLVQTLSQRAREVGFTAPYSDLNKGVVIYETATSFSSYGFFHVIRITELTQGSCKVEIATVGKIKQLIDYSKKYHVATVNAVNWLLTNQFPR